MSFFNDMRHTPAATKPPGTTSSVAGGADPLANLSMIQSRMDSLHQFLSGSVNKNSLLNQAEMDMVSTEISSAIRQIIVNGAALLQENPVGKMVESCTKVVTNPKLEIHVEEYDDRDVDDGYEVIEIDAVELLAEHVHFCEICGKGFKRDANLRMHMRAHGNQFKTPEALAKPEKGVDSMNLKKKFSCPFVGCNRNKQHKKFRPLKSAICVKNHFKRSHCPKMYSCNRCNKKSFSVLADLKSHLKHCGESKWKCSCGTSFSRKDKLFGHMALFEGHMPAVVEEAEVEGKGKEVMEEREMNVKDVVVNGGLSSGNTELFDEFLDGFGSIENYCFGDMLGSPDATTNNGGFGMDGFFNNF